GAAAVSQAGAPAVIPLATGLLALAVALGERAIPPRARTAGAAGGLGSTLLALRVLRGPAATPPPPLPDDRGPWAAIVESVGSPRDGAQAARLRLTTEAGDVPVAATL